MFKNVKIREALVSPEDFRLFCDMDVSDGLQRVPQSLRELVLDKAERWLNYSFPVITQSCWQEYHRYGNRYNYEIYFVDRWLALAELLWAELLEKQGRFIEKIMDVIWMMEDCPTWVIPPHSRFQNTLPPTDQGEESELDLFSSETGALLCLAYYFFHDAFEDRIPHTFNERLHREIDRRILKPFLKNDFHWYKKGGNWNIWICSNLLLMAGIMEKSLDRREDIASRCLESAQVYIDTFPKDGFCPEGPRYFMLSSGCFFDFVELLYDLTGGEIDYTNCSLVREMLTYPLYFHPSPNVCVNFGDAEVNLTPDIIQLRRMAQRAERKDVFDYAGRMCHDFKGFHNMTCNHYRRLKDLLYSGQMPLSRLAVDRPPLPFYSEDIKTAFFESKGLYLAAKASNNAQPHGHNDTGSFVIFCNGQPLLVDPGMDIYSAFGWNPDICPYRHARYHNMPIINGYAQQSGGQATAKEVVFEGQSFSYDLSACYPEQAGVKQLQRCIQQTNMGFTITDHWQIDGDGSVELVLMSKERPCFDTENHTISFGGLPTIISYSEFLEPVVDLLDSKDTHGNEKAQKEHLLRVDYRQVAPRLPSETNVIVPNDLKEQWGQTILYRTRLRVNNMPEGTATLTIEALA